MVKNEHDYTADGMSRPRKMLAMYQDELIPGFRKQIEELEGTVCDLRKKWQMAETHICTMCEHFDHKADGNIVYGNMNCGELVGYPCCGKFELRATDNNVGSKWISVKERLPEIKYHLKKGRNTYTRSVRVLCVCVQKSGKKMVKEGFCEWFSDYPEPCWKIPGTIDSVTHWMPLPEAPKENDNEGAKVNEQDSL